MLSVDIFPCATDGSKLVTESSIINGRRKEEFQGVNLCRLGSGAVLWWRRRNR